jgi:hypothetical protein
MSNNLILNSANVTNQPNVFQYNFLNGAFIVPDGSEMCISGITIPYSWYNIQQQYYNNTSFQITWTSGVITSTYTINLQNGHYSVDTLNQFLQGVLINLGLYLVDANSDNVYYLSMVYNVSTYSVQLLSFAVPTVLPAGFTNPAGLVLPTVASTPQFIILPTNNFGSIIGFTAGTYPPVIQPTNYSVLSNTLPNGSPVNSIIVRCNLVSNNVISPSDILDSFQITGAFGSNLNITPNFEKWIKIKSGRYSNFTITFQDQNFNNIPILDTNLLITLLLKTGK